MAEQQIMVSAGKVPGGVVEMLVKAGSTVLEVMTAAAQKSGFKFTTSPYQSGSQEMLDVPFMNGKELCRREGNMIKEVFWQTKVSAGDIILIVPRIRGN